MANPSIICITDASSSWGCGAQSDQEWFQLQWVEPINSYSITLKKALVHCLNCCSVGQPMEGPYSESER